MGAHKDKAGPHICKHERLIARRDRALDREIDRENRSDSEQLALIGTRHGESKRETAKLTRRLND